MQEIQMKIHGMSTSIQPADAYALVLEEIDGKGRKLPVIIGPLEAQAIKVTMVKYRTPRPMTHDLFISFAEKMGVRIRKIVIYRVKDGIFYSYIHLDKEGEEIKIDSRTSDAIALALRSGCPIYANREILDNEFMGDMGDGAFSVTINMVSIDMLKEALQKAVEAENYEQASQLRDEIRRRESNQDANETNE